MTTGSCINSSVLVLVAALAVLPGCDAVKTLFKGEPTPEERAQLALGRAEAFLAQGQLDEAQAAFDEAYKANPRQGAAVLGLAVVYLERGEEGRALLQLQQAQLLLPEDPRPPAIMGDIQNNQARYRRAAKSYERAMRLADGDSELRRRYALALMRAGDLREAGYQIERLLRDDPGNPVFESAEGLLLAAQGDIRRARNVLEDAAQSSPGPEAPAALGVFLLHQGEPASAVRALRQAVTNGGGPDIQRLLAEALVESGDGVGAAEVTGPLVAARPLDPLARSVHARALVASGAYDEALTAANEAIRLDPNLAQALLARGAALEARGNLEGAAASYKAAAAEAPDLADSYRQLASVYRKMDRSVDAISALEKLVAVDPHDRRSAETLLELYADSPVHAPEGLALVRRLLEDDPRDPTLQRLERQLERNNADLPKTRRSGGSKGLRIIRGGRK